MSPKAKARSRQAETSAVEALAISKNLLRSMLDFLAFPSAKFNTIDAIARLVWSARYPSPLGHLALSLLTRDKKIENRNTEKPRHRKTIIDLRSQYIAVFRSISLIIAEFRSNIAVIALDRAGRGVCKESDQVASGLRLSG